MRAGRHFVVFALLCVWPALISGCSGPAPEPDPRAVLTAYLEAVIEGRTEDAAQHLAAGAKGSPGGKQATGSFEEKMVRRALASHVSFEILKVDAVSGQARVKITFPDFSRIAADISGQLKGADFPPDGLEALEYTARLVNRTVNTYKSRGIPMSASVRDFQLTREGGKWKIAGGDLNG